MIPIWCQAFCWGLLAGSALLLGAATGYLASLSQKIVALIMAFGGGVLVSALSFDLMDAAYRQGGFDSTSFGFLAGAIAYTVPNWFLNHRGAKHRKRSGHQQACDSSSGLAIALGALLDGIPESIAIGISMVHGAGVSLVTVISIFLSNLPEGLSSSAGMKKAGRSPGYIFGLWGGIAVVSALSSWIGYGVFGNFSPEVTGAITAVAAGAILAMLADTMIPEAFEGAHEFVGLVTVAGFLAAFVLSKFSGE